MTAFVASKFGYSPLTFHSRKNNSKINHIYERALRIVYNENISALVELLKKNDSFSIHHRNIQSLAIQQFSTRIICDIFENRDKSYNLRSRVDFMRTRVNISKSGIN